jgi:hypothetical protein
MSDNKKDAIKAYQAEHGCNYTTAKRAIEAQIAERRGPWAYKHQTPTRRMYDLYVTALDEGDSYEQWTAKFNQRVRDAVDEDRNAGIVVDDYENASQRVEWSTESDGYFPLLDEINRHWKNRPCLKVVESWSAAADDIFVEHPIDLLSDVWNNGEINYIDAIEAIEKFLEGHQASMTGYWLLGGIHSWSAENNDDNLADYEAWEAYEVAAAIAYALLPEGNKPWRIDWAWVQNRDLLRCLLGAMRARWRHGDIKGAITMAENLLWLSPNDNLGIRYDYAALLDGWEWQPSNW